MNQSEIEKIVEQVLGDYSFNVDPDDVRTAAAGEFAAMDVKLSNAQSEFAGRLDLHTEEYRNDMQETVRAVMAAEAVANSASSAITALVESVNKALGGAKGAAKVAIAKTVKKAVESSGSVAGGGRAMQVLGRYQPPGNAPVGAGVMFLGPQGTGKTYGPRMYGRGAGFTHPSGLIEVGGFEGLEALDLLGGCDPGHIGKGDAWRDGPIAAAFRWVGSSTEEGIPAAVEAGETVLLLIDEINRLPARERSVFLSAMSPEMINGFYCYKLRTGRSVEGPRGVKEDEILYAPCHLLAIVATGNVGLEFNTVQDDPAGRERWIEIAIVPDDDMIRGALRNALEAREFESDNNVERLMELKAKASAMHKDNMLAMSPTVRTLARIINLTPSDRLSDWNQTAKDVGELWCEWNHEGARIPEQLGLLASVIDGIWTP